MIKHSKIKDILPDITVRLKCHISRASREAQLILMNALHVD